MAKKIKFPLEMRDGEQVRNLDELREFFDVEKALGYLLDGNLFTWLQDRYYIPEAEAISRLNTHASDINEQLCRILGVEIVTTVSGVAIEKEYNREKGKKHLKRVARHRSSYAMAKWTWR